MPYSTSLSKTKLVTANSPERAACQENLLKFIVCGSVDDGKSTLIGRMLYDSNKVYDDHIQTLKKDTERLSREEEIDFSLLVDGLKDEREQGITIDLSFRFFSSTKRRYMVIDAPGHEQYTKNMAAGASMASVGIVLVDATKGILTQTIRHTYILYLMGVRHFILCINKMDLLDYSESHYKILNNNYAQLLKSMGAGEDHHFYSIPVSAIKGVNLFTKSNETPWYQGMPLYQYLEEIDVAEDISTDTVLPVQLVSRPNSEFRGYMGTLAGGELSPGDEVRLLPSNQECLIQKIVTFDGLLEKALPGEAITVVLDREMSLVRGDLIVKKDVQIEQASQFKVKLLSVSSDNIHAGRSYIFKFGHNTVMGSITKIKSKVDLSTLEQITSNSLSINDFGTCNILLTKEVLYKAYMENKVLGSFLVIDRITKDTVAVGMIEHELHRSNNVIDADTNITSVARAKLKQQKPCVVWLTGMSGAGKTTIANLVEAKLYSLNYHTYLIDGDHVRKDLCSDLGFSESDRIENIRRIGFLSKYFVEAGLITLVAVISPYRNERLAVKDQFASDQFIEVYVKASLDTCQKRDPKKLYSKFKEGRVPNLTGLGSDYEPPLSPDVLADTELDSAEGIADQIVQHILRYQDKQ